MGSARVYSSASVAPRLSCPTTTSQRQSQPAKHLYGSSPVPLSRRQDSLLPPPQVFQIRGYTLSPPQYSPTSFQVYNSLSQSIQDLGTKDIGTNRSESATPLRKGIAVYTCGPTTYAPAHLGHARTYVCLDILRRCMEYTHGGTTLYPPLFVMNITDVDDKLLQASLSSSCSPIELARRYEADFWNDLQALNCLRPHIVTRVTDYVESHIVPYIAKIVQHGMAYQLQSHDEDGSGVYFDVRAFEGKPSSLHGSTLNRYGKLAPPAASTDFFDATKESNDLKDDESITKDGFRTTKKDARDFVLWKLRKNGERMYWPSPWGDGRPGWHIECSAMIDAIQTMVADTHVFAVHAGGVDLKFPHHTNEIAQAEAHKFGNDTESVNQEWIPHWIHTGHLHIDGLKMSKSLKNFITIEEMLAKDDGEAHSTLSSPADDFRLWCLGLSGSYRGTATYSKDRLLEARNIREKKLVRFLMDGQEWLNRSEQVPSMSAVKLWRDVDFEFFKEWNNAAANALAALLKKDLDGAGFLDEVIRMTTIGKAYIDKHPPGSAPIEIVEAPLTKVRELLSLVGFSDVTCRAGMDNRKDEDSSSHIVGGPRALLDEFVSFREAVRTVAVADLKERASTQGSRDTCVGAREILRLSDDLRDNVLPSIGVELIDAKVGEEASIESSWKFCLPRSSTEEEDGDTPESSKRQVSKGDLRSVSLEDFFHVGQYEGKFSAFGSDGLPSHHADGSPLSNRLLKKLKKKREIHAKRIDALKSEKK